MTNDAVQSALRARFTFICATCTKLHALRSKGEDGCLGNVPGKSCSGPIAGGSYPEYEGPLKANMTSRCFLTGEPSTGAVELPDGKLIGVSARAIEVLGTYSKDGEKPAFLSHAHLPVVG